MFNRFVRKIKLILNPPKSGDVFYGDPIFFIIHKPIEYVLHGLKNKHGENICDPIPSKGCFRLTISLCGHIYFLLDSEILCKFNDDEGQGSWFWMKRTQPKRLAKEALEELILSGMLWRDNSE